MTNSGEIEKDLRAYYYVTEPSTVGETLSKIYIDPRTQISIETNDYNQLYIRYNSDNSQNNQEY
jgi:hypothetical protein